MHAPRNANHLTTFQETFDAKSETYQQFLKILREYYDAFRKDVEEVVAQHQAAKAGGDAVKPPPPDYVSKRREERTRETLEEVKKLFVGHEDLIEGFEAFLPQSGSE